MLRLQRHHSAAATASRQLLLDAGSSCLPARAAYSAVPSSACLKRRAWTVRSQQIASLASVLRMPHQMPTAARAAPAAPALAAGAGQDAARHAGGDQRQPGRVPGHGERAGGSLAVCRPSLPFVHSSLCLLCLGAPPHPHPPTPTPTPSRVQPVVPPRRHVGLCCWAALLFHRDASLRAVAPAALGQQGLGPRHRATRRLLRRPRTHWWSACRVASRRLRR